MRKTRPQVKFVELAGAAPELTLNNLDTLNALSSDGGRDIYLTSVDDVTTNPAWLDGYAPDPTTGKTGDAVTSLIIVTDRGGGNVDAFYFYFFASVESILTEDGCYEFVVLANGGW